MKKLFTILAIFCITTTFAQQWPAGASTAIVVANTGTTAVTISNRMNHVASITTLTANVTVSVTVSGQLKAGAMILLTVKTTSAETTTFAGSIVAPVITGDAGKTWSQAYLYNGTNFYPMGAKIQVD